MVLEQQDGFVLILFGGVYLVSIFVLKSYLSDLSDNDLDFILLKAWTWTRLRHVLDNNRPEA